MMLMILFSPFAIAPASLLMPLMPLNTRRRSTSILSLTK